MISRKILGVRIDFGLNMEKALDIIENKLLKDSNNHIVCTTNPEFVIDAQEDSDFREIINNSSLSVPDGIGVIFAKNYLNALDSLKRNFLFPVRAFIKGLGIGASSFFNKNSLKEERISGVDLTYEICKLSSKRLYNFFLGGRKTPSAIIMR